MVFKPFTHLARQSFAKTFTHGYAQTVVAATQSSYASSTTPFSPFGNHQSSRFGKPGTVQLHNAFHNASSSAGVANKNQPSQTADGVDAGLAAYFEAWQNQQRHGEGKEWKQFQFAKRIGWKCSTIAVEGKGKEKENLCLPLDASLDREGLDRAYSASAIDDIKRVEDDAAEATAVANVDEAIAKEIRHIQQSAASRDEVQSSVVSDFHDQTIKQPSAVLGESDSPSTVSSYGTTTAENRSTGSSDTTTSTFAQETDSQAFSDYIDNLHDSQSFAEIPRVFESMLIQGLRPSIKAYNALLAAAIHLPTAKHQIVPKALDVYSDMLRRKLLPDTAFYTTIIQLLSRRALDVFRMKASMNKRRLRFGGLRESGQFLFRSNEAEYDILTEDNALTNAVKIFDSSVTSSISRIYSSETYQLLVTACAMHNRVDDMIRAYSHMERHGVTPIAGMFPPMIAAFGATGDLSSAVECYNEYKLLAIANDAGETAILNRRDSEVYAAVIKAYTANSHDGGHRFFAKILDSYGTVTDRRIERVEALHDAIVLDAFVQERLDSGKHIEAFKIAEEQNLTPSVRSQAMARICTAAADQDNADLANKSYQHIVPASAEASAANLSMLALHIRQGNVDLAREYWAILNSSPDLHALSVEPTAMYAVALIGSGNPDEGLVQARQAFAHIRSYSKSSSAKHDIAEEIDECIELIGAYLADNGIVPSPQASMSFLSAMIENRGLVSPVAERLLAGLSSHNISSLSWHDLTLALRIEAEIVGDGKAMYDVAHSVRFAHILESVIGNGISVDKYTSELVEHALRTLSPQRPDLSDRWQNYRHAVGRTAFSPAPYTTQKASPAIATASTYTDSFDPYAATTDHRGSAIIADELDSHRARPDVALHEALLRFKNMRRAGRHPRYIVYAKLISSAAKEGRTSLVFDILGMARQDVPFLTHNSVVRHGWTAILDAMVGACLTVGNRTFAAQFHQELLDMGAAPTANTFGLYITTLKDSTKTFDEATEAVKIFHRAKSEGVEPSSFLYNALVGKLGKARRIDDCLYYFAEMRGLGIRPTSVTYGTIVNALCRVSDERFAEELFDEMESMSNYKPRPAPYNSLMQFFLTTKRDRGKVLAYYERMLSKKIQPTMHTYKLLIDTYATLDPVDLAAAEGVLDTIRALGQKPEAVHYASLIHAKGCALHDIAGARQTFDEVLAKGEVRPQACLYQALFESMVANHCVVDTEKVLDEMSAARVEMTPYIANTLIHGWAMEKNIAKSKAVYESVGVEKREPSTYEAMTRAFLTVENRDGASGCVQEMLSRGYPSAVAGKILDLLGHSVNRADLVVPPGL
ncbi:hypothetical protein MMC07_002106 [Pseudocyphellaria aurata]|nr:hypothetical protein [Pseudocyphellaria aurata]